MDGTCELEPVRPLHLHIVMVLKVWLRSNGVWTHILMAGGLQNRLTHFGPPDFDSGFVISTLRFYQLGVPELGV